MKYKLLAVSVDTGEHVNIGDYIQALAAAQFLPEVDGFVQRERLKEYDGEACKVIMNGWYMHHTEHWPPSDKIKPLFVAFHINASAKEGMLTEDSINSLRSSSQSDAVITLQGICSCRKAWTHIFPHA